MDDRFNTAAGWLLFAGVVGLGASIVSGKFFHADNPEMPEKPGYFVEGVAAEGGEEGPDLGTLLAAADADAGAKVFAKCTACHTIESGGANGIGPNLHGVMGTAIGGHAPGFAYSSALKDKGGEWSWENMNEWLKSPRGFANGTKMSFAGLSKPEDRANVMEYMAANGGAPAKPAPAAPEEEAEEGAVEGEEAIDGAAEGPGAVEGGDPSAVEAAGAMGAAQPVPGDATTGATR